MTHALCGAILFLAAGSSRAGDDAPRFTRHVLPLFSRLGCNAGTCHGAVKGKNGFRLSLFATQPAEDFSAIARQFAGRRLHRGQPEKSLLLLKASGEVAHLGGQRAAPGSADYELLRRWIAAGAVFDPPEDSRVTALRVSPAEITLAPQANVDLRVEATFADGTTEDVTRFCQFQAREPEVAGVDARGAIQAAGPGETTIVVRYRIEAGLARVLVPGPALAFPAVQEANFVDVPILARLRKLNLPPADRCDDATFLRRVSLSVAGELPEPAAVRAFLADAAPDKRAKKIDELLRSPGHAALWATKFCDLLKPVYREDNRVFREAAHVRRFYEWVRARLAENLPYDQFVERILVATSAEDAAPEVRLRELETIAREDETQSTSLTYGRRTLDLYWLRASSTGVPGTIHAAHAFLGLRLQCAQCHRHPWDVWQQDDLLSFANFFNGVQRVDMYKVSADEKKQQEADAKAVQEESKKLKDQAKALPMGDAKQKELLAQAAEMDQKYGALRRYYYLKNVFTGVSVAEKPRTVSLDTPLGRAESKQFRLLGEGTPVSLSPGQDPRQLVMDWLRRPENPYFAKAIVNRVWAHYFGRGLIEPADDLSPLNPPSHPELLDELCRGFVAAKYDLRWLHAAILNSRVWQQSCQPHPSLPPVGDGLFARQRLRRLPAELLADAVNHATGGREKFPGISHVPAGAKAIETPGMSDFDDNGTGRREQASLDYLFEVFGRSRRDLETQCDCEAGQDPSLTQSLYLAAYRNVQEKIAAPEGRAARWAADLPSAEQQVEEAYLWALCRLPTAEERARFAAHVKAAASAHAGVQDVLWALVNSREFQLWR